MLPPAILWWFLTPAVFASVYASSDFLQQQEIRFRCKSAWKEMQMRTLDKRRVGYLERDGLISYFYEENTPAPMSVPANSLKAGGVCCVSYRRPEEQPIMMWLCLAFSHQLKLSHLNNSLFGQCKVLVADPPTVVLSVGIMFVYAARGRKLL